jgi:hypothetical protein
MTLGGMLTSVQTFTRMKQRWTAVALVFSALSAVAQPPSDFRASKPEHDGYFAVLVSGTDTLYSNHVPQGRHTVTYRSKYSGIYLVMDNSGRIKMKCYLSRGKLTGYYQIYDSSGKAREEGYYDQGALLYRRELP